MESLRFWTWRDDHGVGWLTLARPERANAYHAPMLEELGAVISRLEGDLSVRVVVVTGQGANFCAGADLGEISSRSPMDVLDLKSQRLFSRLARLPQVTLAAINGPAVAGGLELALACDLRMASSAARLALPETSLGILPAAGGTQRLPRLIGVARAKEMVLAARSVAAADALSWGLVGAVHAPDQLLEEAAQLARTLAGRDPLVLRLAKEAIDLPGTPEGGLRLETLAQALLSTRGR